MPDFAQPELSDREKADRAYGTARELAIAEYRALYTETKKTVKRLGYLATFIRSGSSLLNVVTPPEVDLSHERLTIINQKDGR